jgi:hypothetical protein
LFYKYKILIKRKGGCECHARASKWTSLVSFRTTHTASYDDETLPYMEALEAYRRSFPGGTTCVRWRDSLTTVNFFSSPSFFLSLLLPKCEGVFSFIFYIQFGPYFFYCYFFLHILLINFLFNYIPHHLVLFYFYIKFGPYFFYFLKAFTNWILFSILSLNIWF